MAFFNEIDLAILHAMNAFAGQSPLFDQMVRFAAYFSITKGGLFVAILWALWFVNSEEQEATRRRILRVIAGAAAAVAVGRLLQLLLPMRLRPRHDPDIDFTLPYSADPETLVGWSSFPSDHAVLFFALAAGIYACHRRVGVFLLGWAFFVIGLPRVYIGLHHFSDIVVGGVVGAVVMFATLRMPVSAHLSERVIKWEHAQPALFYPAAFIVTWQIAVLGTDIRSLGSAISKFIGLVF